MKKHLTTVSSDEYITLADLSILLKVNKSRLAFYRSVGLLEPELVVGRTAIYNRVQAITRFEMIAKMRKEHSLKEIAGILSIKK